MIHLVTLETSHAALLSESGCSGADRENDGRLDDDSICEAAESGPSHRYSASRRRRICFARWEDGGAVLRAAIGRMIGRKWSEVNGGLRHR